MADMLRQEVGQGAFPAVLHCFTGGRELAFTAIELGLYVSFTGILTFKKTEELRAIARDLPVMYEHSVKELTFDDSGRDVTTGLLTVGPA